LIRNPAGLLIKGSVVRLIGRTTNRLIDQLSYYLNTTEVPMVCANCIERIRAGQSRIICNHVVMQQPTAQSDDDDCIMVGPESYNETQRMFARAKGRNKPNDPNSSKSGFALPSSQFIHSSDSGMKAPKPGSAQKASKKRADERANDQVDTPSEWKEFNCELWLLYDGRPIHGQSIQEDMCVDTTRDVASVDEWVRSLVATSSTWEAKIKTYEKEESLQARACRPGKGKEAPTAFNVDTRANGRVFVSAILLKAGIIGPKQATPRSDKLILLMPVGPKIEEAEEESIGYLTKVTKGKERSNEQPTDQSPPPKIKQEKVSNKKEKIAIKQEQQPIQSNDRTYKRSVEEPGNVKSRFKADPDDSDTSDWLHETEDNNETFARSLEATPAMSLHGRSPEPSPVMSLPDRSLKRRKSAKLVIEGIKEEALVKKRGRPIRPKKRPNRLE
jgi:hypothetical protein